MRNDFRFLAMLEMTLTSQKEDMSTMADYVLLIQMDIPGELEDDFNHYYNTQHVPRISD